VHSPDPEDLTMTTTASAPVLTRAGDVPILRRKLFVNIPVADLQRSVTFFEALGFTFNPMFTGPTATCMLVGEDAYFMLLVPTFFGTFTSRPPADLTQVTPALYAVEVESREAVQAMVATALAAGGSAAMPANDMGFMYQHSFRDPDGHNWEVFWMDPAAAAGGPPPAA
jgi:hypothetical protein